MATNPDDLLPDGNAWFLFPIQKPAPPAAPAPPPSAKPAPPHLTVACVAHKLTARLTPGKHSTVSSVSFAANGTVHRMTKPPYVATIPAKGKSVVTVSAIVHTTSGTQTVRVRAHACRY